ncbi:MAG: alkaline phosphatase [Alkalispirochaeta sp.]
MIHHQHHPADRSARPVRNVYRHRLPAHFRIMFFAAMVILVLAASGCTAEEGPSMQVQPRVDAPLEEPPLTVQQTPDPTEGGARRIILVIGDGMGAAQLEAASRYHTGTENGLVLQSLPLTATMETGSASHAITDSAAAGTALATAVKVRNGVVGMRFPGDGSELPSVTEELAAKGWATGLVTTAYTTHATPASFGAHVESRMDFGGIADDYLTQTRPDVILGGGGYGMDPDIVGDAGYTVVRDAASLASTAREISPGDKIAGLFGEGHIPYLADGRPGEIPDLVEMAETAVDILARDEDGFFLMIEGARIDHAGHANDIRRLIPEVLELDAVVEMLLSHPELQEDTLLVVTADHETGGLAVSRDRGAGRLPEVTWSTTGHTATPVPLYATGSGADALKAVVDNTHLRGALLSALEPSGVGSRLTQGRLTPGPSPAIATPGAKEEREPSLP